MNCQKCNFQNEENAKFCKNCGVELSFQQSQPTSATRICPKCNFQNVDDIHHFCGKCGAELYAQTEEKKGKNGFILRAKTGTENNDFGLAGFITSLFTVSLGYTLYFIHEVCNKITELNEIHYALNRVDEIRQFFWLATLLGAVLSLKGAFANKNRVLGILGIILSFISFLITS